MTCFHPYYLFDNGVHPSGKPKYTTYRTPKTTLLKPKLVPCGRCIGCRMEKARQWAIRCMHELRYHEKSCFLTLTYDKEHISDDYSLSPADMTCFIKRLRKHYPSIRIKYLQCGEYGTLKGRPHHHMILFGIDFSECRYFFERTRNKDILFRSDFLDSVWGNGMCIIGDVTLESVQYVCRYTLKKRYGDDASTYYGKRKPEYITSSKRPAIGRRFFEEFLSDIYPHDFVIYNGRKTKVPAYYDRLLSQHHEDMFNFVKENRIRHALKNPIDFEVLARREEVLKSRSIKLRRGLEMRC